MNGILSRPAREGIAPALVVLLIVLWVLAAYARTTSDMVAIWARSETFAHGILIIPIVAWLVWRKRGELRVVPPSPSRLALLGLVAAGAAWWLAKTLGVGTAAQFAMLSMVPLGVAATLGMAAVRRLAFPLGFLFFAVPFGEFLMPYLIDRTADVTILALQMTGVPVYREGNFFTIPSGHWSVVEACSGLRYLIASVVVGSLFAYLSFRSPVRRAAFVAASIAVPVVANWIRAYAIVLLAHVSGNKLATGVDHLVYGWLFFGVVMLVLFAIGLRWREDTAQDDGRSQDAVPRSAAQATRVPLSACLATILLIGLWPAVDSLRASEPPSSALLLQPIAAAPGWTTAQAEFTRFHPDITGARVTLEQTFARGAANVSLYVAMYREQGTGVRALSTENRLVRSTNKQWAQLETKRLPLVIAGEDVSAQSAVVAHEGERFLVAAWYWVNGHPTGSLYHAKLLEAWSVLSGRGDAIAWVVAYTRLAPEPATSEQQLRGFVSDFGPAIETALRRAATP